MRDFQDDDPVDRLRLIRSRRVGAVTFHRLVAEHGSVRAALAALPDVARAAGVADYAPCPVEVARHEMAQARLAGARMIVPGGAGYPAALEGMPDAPPVLWALGDVALLSRPSIAIVGARNASSLGVRMARRLSKELGEAGQVVVSGLARGIDTEAHLAALETGTVAVMAGGVDVIYPEENVALAARIAREGCLLSEQPMGLVPQARHFPLRNRIIAGLARAVVVVEAAARSGSLITARDALDLGREVLAVPGHPFDARAAGCNMLIRDGAVLVRSAADVLEAIGLAGGEGVVLDGAALAAAPLGAEAERQAVVPAARSAVMGRPDNAPGAPGDGGARAGLQGRADGADGADGRLGHDRRAAVACVPEAAARPGDPPRATRPDEAAPPGAAAPAPVAARADAGRAVTDARPVAGPVSGSVPEPVSAPVSGPVSGPVAPWVSEPDAETVGRPSGSALAPLRGPAARPMAGGVGTLPGPVAATRSLAETAVLHRMILDRLGPSAMPEDQLIRDLDLPTETVARELVALEVEGQVLRHAGGLLSRC